jgi:hypothetical protein
VQKHESDPARKVNDDAQFVYDEEFVVGKEENGSQALDSDGDPVLCKIDPVNLKPRGLAISSKWSEDFKSPEKLDASKSRSPEQQRGPWLNIKTFLVAFVLTPCIFAVSAAIFADIRDEGRHFNNIDPEIVNSTSDIDRNPNEWSNYYKRAWWYLCNESYDRALRDLDLAIQHSRGDASAKEAIDERRKTILRLRRDHWWY